MSRRLFGATLRFADPAGFKPVFATGRHRITALLLVLCLPVVLAGCITSPDSQRMVSVTIVAASGLNPDAQGRPCPVVVRIYSVHRPDDFQHATFFKLYDDERKVLAQDASSRAEVIVYPGQRVRLSYVLGKGDRSLAVLAAFRDIYRARWRAVAHVPDDDDEAWTIRLGSNDVALAPEGGVTVSQQTAPSGPPVGGKPSAVKPSGMSFPDMKLPDVQLPDMKPSDAKPPDVKLPDVNLPHMNPPGVAADASQKPSISHLTGSLEGAMKHALEQ